MSGAANSAATANAGAAAGAAAAVAMQQAQRLMVGGMLVRLEPRDFETLAEHLVELVVTGEVGWWLSKKRVYLMPYRNLTFYCKVATGERLSVDAIEVKKIDKGPLDL